jgi:hypothetical protein
MRYLKDVSRRFKNGFRWVLFLSLSLVWRVGWRRLTRQVRG